MDYTLSDFLKFLDQCLETYPSDIDDKTNAVLQTVKYRAEKLKDELQTRLNEDVTPFNWIQITEILGDEE